MRGTRGQRPRVCHGCIERTPSVYIIFIFYYYSGYGRNHFYSGPLKWHTKNRPPLDQTSMVFPSISLDVEMNSPHYRPSCWCCGPRFHLKPRVYTCSALPKGMRPQHILLILWEILISYLMFGRRQYIMLVCPNRTICSFSCSAHNLVALCMDESVWSILPPKAPNTNTLFHPFSIDFFTAFSKSFVSWFQTWFSSTPLALQKVSTYGLRLSKSPTILRTFLQCLKGVLQKRLAPPSARTTLSALFKALQSHYWLSWLLTTTTESMRELTISNFQKSQTTRSSSSQMTQLELLLKQRAKVNPLCRRQTKACLRNIRNYKLKNKCRLQSQSSNKSTSPSLPILYVYSTIPSLSFFCASWNPYFLSFSLPL